MLAQAFHPLHLLLEARLLPPPLAAAELLRTPNPTLFQSLVPLCAQDLTFNLLSLPPACSPLSTGENWVALCTQPGGQTPADGVEKNPLPQAFFPAPASIQRPSWIPQFGCPLSPLLWLSKMMSREIWEER